MVVPAGRRGGLCLSSQVAIRSQVSAIASNVFRSLSSVMASALARTSCARIRYSSDRFGGFRQGICAVLPGDNRAQLPSAVNLVANSEEQDTHWIRLISARPRSTLHLLPGKVEAMKAVECWLQRERCRHLARI